ncbi:hypothetical protein ACOJBQ_001586 [Cronobacter muytjensii]|uniref:Uncharacterized protein n=1 Tax=Cronobacter universalis NCTC 9529 TaxID=1074000 RepID=A0AAC8VPV7_9ENTR|nr:MULTISPECIES: hypothetical protein [Cronobacter]ALB54851.1 hypothetical protein AFK65_09305 [Cronobacter universalis NCTC 9529]ELY4670845.1 hypothetical protein [Cronobacter muytjensii]NUW61780.1 hypothetical protein [Cronobacter muytjensii]STD07043.1 Uncharacterised protein [Cronobacter universalis NCTC 9529]
MVEVHTREYPDLKMQAEFTPGIKPGRNGPSVNNQLKVLKSEVSIRLFSQLNDKRCIGFSLDGAGYVDYYYLAADKVGFIFQSNP